MLISLIKVQHHGNIPAYLAYPPYSGTDEPGKLFKFRYLPFGPEDSVGDLISHLDHVRQTSFRFQPKQCFLCILIQGHFQLRRSVIFPDFWLYLLSGVCPEVTIMEIQQILKSGCLHPFDHPERGIQIIGACTVRSSLLCIRVQPETKADIIYSVRLQNISQLPFLSLIVVLSSQTNHLIH